MAAKDEMMAAEAEVKGWYAKGKAFCLKWLDKPWKQFLAVAVVAMILGHFLFPRVVHYVPSMATLESYVSSDSYSRAEMDAKFDALANDMAEVGVRETKNSEAIADLQSRVMALEAVKSKKHR